MLNIEYIQTRQEFKKDAVVEIIIYLKEINLNRRTIIIAYVIFKKLFGYDSVKIVKLFLQVIDFWHIL